MITEYYPNPKAKKAWQYPVSTSVATVPSNTYGVMANGLSPLFNEGEARRKNITIEEFVRRDCLVRGWAKEAEQLWTGKLVYPCTLKDYEEKGPHRITEVRRTYGSFPNTDVWNENTARYIVGAKSEKDGSYTIATAKYFIHQIPTE